MKRRLLALLLLAALLLAGCAESAPAVPYSLTLWYVEGDPLAAALARFASDYNAARGRDALPVTLRAFESEERLLAAIQSGAAPALALLGHESALLLAESGALYDPGLSPDYPAWLRESAACVGRGWYPLGFAVPLLRYTEPAPASLSALLAEAARRGEPCLRVGAFAPLFRQALFDAGERFDADFAGAQESEGFVRLYNALAEAVFSGGLSLGEGDALPWVIDESPALHTQDAPGASYCPLSEGALLAEGRGLAVTARDARMRRALPDCLRRFFESEGFAAAALDAGLIPAPSRTRATEGALEELLLALSARPLRLPEDAAYLRRRADFEAQLRGALSLLR